MKRFRIAAASAVVLLFLGAASPAWAHDHRRVGAYDFTVGWISEPTYAGFPNAVQLIVKDAAGKPIDDLGSPPTLKVEVGTGTQKSDPLAFKASFDPDTGFGTHGEFDSEIIPTRPGVYTFRIFGTINGQAVNETFTSSDTTFDSVREPAEVEFPTKDPSTGQLATSIQQLTPRVDTAVAAAKTQAKAAKNAKDKASTATTLAIVALVAGVVLGGAGLVTGLGARRRS
ncbi:MAG: hypothetical protein JWO37_3149 [Acidimicrobiales bacterium]|jgi:hypothetical protein|nr:hypothetical protein [Acidimicrobiales bacterium]